MRIRRLMPAVLASALLAACASAPQKPVVLSADAINRHEGRIGVVMNRMPKVDTSFPGASCLLCLAAASAANTSLTSHAHTLATDDVAAYKKNMIEALRKKGYVVTDLEAPLDVTKLPDARDKTPDHAKKDFTSLRARYNVDKLCVIEVDHLGFSRTYAAYIPTSEPAAVVSGRAYLVDLTSNAYDWYQVVNINQKTDGKWDEPPSFPGLTNAYFQAIEAARSQYLGPFRN